MRSVIVVGPECTGSTWTTQLLNAHPSITADHQSYPRNRGADALWPYLDALDPEKQAVVVICIRDRSITELSQQRSGYREGRNDDFLDDPISKAMAKILSQSSGRRRVWCSYEGLIGWGIEYFNELLRQIGVSPDEYPEDAFSSIDGNKKYIKSE